MTRIIILTGNHLCHNPRVIKEAVALSTAGYEVTVLGGWFDPVLKERDKKLQTSVSFKFVPVVDTTRNAIYRFGPRLKSKLGAITHRIGRVENHWQLGHAYAALRWAALERPADLYIAHSEAAMAAAVDLLQSGRRVAIDMEDWFSEDLLPETRQNRPVQLLRSFECTLLKHGTYATCTSYAMSTALEQEFHCRPPTVVYNAFLWSDRKTVDGLRKDRKNQRIPSIHWFSQTLGPGRGLEDLLAALSLVSHPIEIHLRGISSAQFETWLWNRVSKKWRGQVFLHGLVSNDELLSRIAEHDIGFAGEMKDCQSRNLTVTNKILQYLLAGLAVVASDTAGQREIAEQAANAVLLYPAGDAAALAGCIERLLGCLKDLDLAKTSALHAAKQTFCWERQEKLLLDTVKQTLTEPALVHETL